MSRPKCPVPIPAWVTSAALDHRRGGPARVADAPVVTKPILVASNPKPVASGLVGHPRPTLAVSNGETLLPEVQWR